MDAWLQGEMTAVRRDPTHTCCDLILGFLDLLL